MKHCRIFAIIASLCLFSGVFAGCASPSGDSGTAAPDTEAPTSTLAAVEGERVVLKLAISASEGGFSDIVMESNERFMQKFPHVAVEPAILSASGWGEQASKMMAMIAAGNAPDITHMAVEGTRLMVANGLLEALDPFCEGDAFIEEMRRDVDQTMWDCFTIDGKLYELPGGWNNMCIYYNTRMFEEAGIVPNPEWDWAEFLDVAQALTTGEGDNKVYGYVIPVDHFTIMPWILTNGVYPLKDDMRASNYADPKVGEALQFMYDLYDVHGVAPFPDMNMDIFSLFTSGRVAMVAGGQWPVSICKAAGFEDYDIIPFPYQGQRTTVFGTGGYAMLTSCQDKGLAFELLKEYAGVEAQQVEADRGIGIPSRYSISLTSPFADQPPNAKLFYEDLATAQVVPSPTIFNEMHDIFMRAASSIFAGNMTAAQAMAEADAELAKAFEQAP